MIKIISYLIFVCIPMNMLVGMELQRDKEKINLMLVDDNNKVYSIARWKVVQEFNQFDTLNVPEINEQQISYFDKELDTIDLQIIQNNDNVLKQEIKKKILSGRHPVYRTTFDVSVHYSAYKTAFDYLLVSIIADNIRSNRVKSEKAYPFESKSNISPIYKLKTLKINFYADEPVITSIPLSTMQCVGTNTKDASCVNVYNKVENNCFGEYIGTVLYDQKNINWLGVTTDLRYLVATFNNMLVSKAELYSESDLTAYKEITNNIKLADIYLLLHLYKAKKEGRRAELQKNEHEYVRDYLTTNEKGKELIQKHFLS